MTNKQNHSISRLFVTALLVTITLLTACKKIDSLSINGQKKAKGAEQFFTINTTTDPLINRVVQRLKDISVNNNNYVQHIVDKYGFAYWNKWLTYENGNSYSSRSQNSNGDTIVVIPLVQNTDTTVNSYLEATIGDSISIEFHNKIEYATVPFSTSNKLCNDAEKVALLYMHLSNVVFNTTQFKVLDKRLFHQSANYADTGLVTRFVKIEAVSNSGRAQLLAINLCYNITVWTIGMNWHCVGCTGPCDMCTAQCVDYYVTSNTELQCFTDYIETGSGSGSGGGGGGGGSWTPTSYSMNSIYLADLLQLPIAKKDWLNSHPAEAQYVYDFLEESRNIDPEEDPLPVGYTPIQSINVAKAAIEIAFNYSLYIYTEPPYNAIKQYFPNIGGTITQQSDIFWSYFTFHAASSKDMNPGFTDFQHYLYGLSKINDCTLLQSATGFTVANLNTNYLQTISGLGLNAGFLNQSPINSTTDLTPVEFKRKTITNPQGKKIDIVWYKDNVTGKITFGDRGQLREVLGLPKGDPRVAHHIVPVNVCIDNTNGGQVIQVLGAKGLFHMNQSGNGIPISTPGSHPAYDARVRFHLNNIWIQNQNNITTMNTSVITLIQQIRNLFISYPTYTPTQIATLF